MTLKDKFLNVLHQQNIQVLYVPVIRYDSTKKNEFDMIEFSIENGSIVIKPVTGIQCILFGAKSYELNCKDYSNITNEIYIKYIKELKKSVSSFKIYLEAIQKELPDDTIIEFFINDNDNKIGIYQYIDLKNEYKFYIGFRLFNYKNRIRKLIISCKNYKIDSCKLEIRNINFTQERKDND